MAATYVSGTPNTSYVNIGSYPKRGGDVMPYAIQPDAQKREIEECKSMNAALEAKNKITDSKLETIETMMKDLLTDVGTIKTIVESKKLDERVTMLEASIPSLEGKIDTIINSRAFRVIKFLCWE